MTGAPGRCVSCRVQFSCHAARGEAVRWHNATVDRFVVLLGEARMTAGELARRPPERDRIACVLLGGINHVAVLTGDTARFTEF